MDNMVDSGPSRAWPDGNTSLLRLLVSKLIPAAIQDVDGARPNQENIVKAVCDYTQLDRPGNTVRIRLNSLVTERQAGGPRRPLRGGRLHAARRPRPAGRVQGPREPRRDGVLEPRHRAPRRRPAAAPGRGPLLRPQGAADLRPRACSTTGRRGPTPRSAASARAARACSGTARASARARASAAAYGPTPNQPPTAPASLTFTVVPERPAPDAADRGVRVRPRSSC